MVFLHEGVFCPGVDLIIQNIQQHHVIMEANCIFDLCYRADKYTLFVISDHESCCHMNGCHGNIVCYDSLWQPYNVFITSNNANQSVGYIKALPPGVMEPWRKPPRKVSYKRTFGMPDQVQTLDVWESQTTESALRWRAPYCSTSYSWSCSWSYSWTHVLGIRTMASLILDHVATNYLYLGTNTERKICFWNCPRTRSW